MAGLSDLVEQNDLVAFMILKPRQSWRREVPCCAMAAGRCVFKAGTVDGETRTLSRLATIRFLHET